MPKQPSQISANDLCELLSARHSEDVFIPECKTGPSMSRKHLRMDAWAMKRSWATPITYGYEIKVSRSDFVNDKKWTGYLKYCSEFYFVCPWGLIKPDELPPEVGLLYATRTGSRLLNKKIAHRRNVTIPEELFRYILMARTRVVREWNLEVNSHKREYWQKWMNHRPLDHEFGGNVSRAIRQTVEHRINEVDRENKRLKKKIVDYDGVQLILNEFGIESAFDVKFAVEKRLRELRDTVPSDLNRSITASITKLENLQVELNRLEGVAHA